jgi:hypothetical protein
MNDPQLSTLRKAIHSCRQEQCTHSELLHRIRFADSCSEAKRVKNRLSHFRPPLAHEGENTGLAARPSYADTV